MVSALGLLAAAISLSACCLLRPPPRAAPILPKPEGTYLVNLPFADEPTRDELMAAYPARALRRGVGGAPTVDCVISKSGALDDCTLAYEAPLGWGFGEAALAEAPRFKYYPLIVGNESIVGKRVMLQIIWNAGGASFRTVSAREPRLTARTSGR